MDQTPIAIEKHEPERRRSSDVVTLGCGCCCCCCCCLHTIGGIVGAAVTPTLGRGSYMPVYYYYDEVADEHVPYLTNPGISAIALFWWVLLGMVLVGFFISAVNGPEGLLVGGVIIALVLPLMQLVSAVVALIVVASMNRPDKSYQIRQLGKAALGLVIGTVAGVLIMVAIGVALSMA